MTTDTSRRMQLTESAREAAEQGRWDLVRDCYHEREQALGDGPVPPAEAEQLVRIDRQIQDRARLAQAALASQLRDAAAIRQRLKGLRQGQGAPSSESGMILLEA